jgi:hypothetical protein
MFIKELDIRLINTPGNLLSNLMRAPPLNHIQFRPTILRLSPGGRAHEKGVFHLSLQAILLYVIREHFGDLSTFKLHQYTPSSAVGRQKSGEVFNRTWDTPPQ